MFQSFGPVPAWRWSSYAAGCAPEPAPEPVEPPDTRPVDEAAIRGLVEEWSAAAEAKDAEAFASFYADDGVLMIEAAPDLEGRTAVLEGLGGMMEDPSPLVRDRRGRGGARR